MTSSDLLAVVIISHGSGVFFSRALIEWQKEFEPGIDLFVCGPKSNFSKFDVPKSAVIDFLDHDIKNRFFEINRRKLTAGMYLGHTYILFVHDRFLPSRGFKSALSENLITEAPDFGGLDVNNLDLSPSLRELRLRHDMIGINIDKALDKLGRLVIPKVSQGASSHVAVNGGAFFINRRVLPVLRRPMRWSEMEDDVMSFDLQKYLGSWYESPQLLTQSKKRLPTITKDYSAARLKIYLYSAACRVLKISLRYCFPSVIVLSLSDFYSMRDIARNNSRSFLIVDPYHRAYMGEFYHTSLEKFMAKLRISTNGNRDFKVLKTRWGWAII